MYNSLTTKCIYNLYVSRTLKILLHCKHVLRYVSLQPVVVWLAELWLLQLLQ